MFVPSLQVYLGVAERTWNAPSPLPTISPLAVAAASRGGKGGSDAAAGSLAELPPGIFDPMGHGSGTGGGSHGRSRGGDDGSGGSGVYPSLNQWRDYGWINYMAVSAPHTGERIYGDFYNAGGC